MFNKFKIGEKVIVRGIGKISLKFFETKGVIVEKDYYYHDYYVILEDGTEEWISENDLYSIGG